MGDFNYRWGVTVGWEENRSFTVLFFLIGSTADRREGLLRHSECRRIVNSYETVVDSASSGRAPRDLLRDDQLRQEAARGNIFHALVRQCRVEGVA